MNRESLPSAAESAAREMPALPHRHHGRKHRSQHDTWWFVLLVIIFVAALAYVFFQ